MLQMQGQQLKLKSICNELQVSSNKLWVYGFIFSFFCSPGLQNITTSSSAGEGNLEGPFKCLLVDLATRQLDSAVVQDKLLDVLSKTHVVHEESKDQTELALYNHYSKD
jgi:hypothetical protein